jgi:hypothetical protein
LTTLLPSAPVIPQWTVFALFPGIFAVHLWSVRLLRRVPTRSTLVATLRQRPTVVRIAFGALFVGAWVVGLVSILQIGGAPTVVHGQYFLNDHGTLIPVTYNGYRHALVLQQRIFTSIPGAFYALGIVMNWPIMGPSVPSVSAISPA